MTDLKEKLKSIDEEIRTLHKFCIDNNFNPYEIEKGAKPLLDNVKFQKKARFAKWSIWISVTIGVLAFLIVYEPSYHFIRGASRLASLKILRYFDWTDVYDSRCLLENPYFIGQQLVEDDCELCANLPPRVEVLSKVSQDVIAEKYLKQDKPFIVKDAMKNWSAMDMFSLKFLSQLYENEEVLRQIAPCMYKTNIKSAKDNARLLLKRGAEGDIDKFYGHWEHCDKMSAKVIRQFYKRPYFIPLMVQMDESNWIFVSSHYTTQQYKPVEIELPMMWIGVVKGAMKIALTPRAPCKKICPTLYVQLHRGEILVVTDMMWMIDYVPATEYELIAIGGGGMFD